MRSIVLYSTVRRMDSWPRTCSVGSRCWMLQAMEIPTEYRAVDAAIAGALKDKSNIALAIHCGVGLPGQICLEQWVHPRSISCHSLRAVHLIDLVHCPPSECAVVHTEYAGLWDSSTTHATISPGLREIKTT
jgi:hypothetical protein